MCLFAHLVVGEGQDDGEMISMIDNGGVRKVVAVTSFGRGDFKSVTILPVDGVLTHRCIVLSLR